MENGTANQTQIKYCSMEEKYFKDVEDLLVVFATDEETFHLCRNCEGGHPEDHRAWIGKLIRAHDWSLTRLAVDTATGRAVGALMNDEGTAARPSTAMDAVRDAGTEAGRLMWGLMETTGEGYDVFQVLGAEKVLYLNFAVVEKRSGIPAAMMTYEEGQRCLSRGSVRHVARRYCKAARYRRQGILTELARQTVELARQSGCQGIIDNATSEFTRRVLTRLGFYQQKFVPFKDTPLGGSSNVDLSACGPEDGDYLMVCRL